MSSLEPEHYPVVVEIPVAWGEMDAYGHVNNAVFLRWCETSRIHYFDKIGLHESMEERRVGAILARACVNYLRPVIFPDTVRVKTKVTRLGKTSFTMEYLLESTRHNLPVATGDSVIVLYDYARGTKTELDAQLRARIAAVEGTGR